jgi:hypothetical protein
VNDELEKIGNEEFVVYFKVLSRHLPERTVLVETADNMLSASTYLKYYILLDKSLIVDH